MRNDLKLAIYAAAGIGVFAILKRYGVLNDVGRWLSDNVPEDYKRQAAHAVKEAKQRVGEAGEYVKDQAGKIGEEVKDRAGKAVSAGNDAVHSIMSKVEETATGDGRSTSHRGGRGSTN